MRRNTALFGASLVAGVAAASGLIMTGGTSSAATGYGAVWANTATGSGSGGKWVNGAYGDSIGSFFGRASGAAGTFSLSAINGAPTVSVSVACVSGEAVTTVVGGGSAGTHAAGSVVPLGEFSGEPFVEGTVTFGKSYNGHISGAYINLDALGGGSFVALGGIDCGAAPTSTSSTSTPTTTPPSSTTTNPPSSTTTNPPSSTPPPPSSTTTNPPSSSTTAPQTTPPPTTEPPTPTPTTTTLPVTG